MGHTDLKSTFSIKFHNQINSTDEITRRCFHAREVQALAATQAPNLVLEGFVKVQRVSLASTHF
jgi:hypothetical protein